MDGSLTDKKIELAVLSLYLRLQFPPVINVYDIMQMSLFIFQADKVLSNMFRFVF